MNMDGIEPEPVYIKAKDVKIVLGSCCVTNLCLCMSSFDLLQLCSTPTTIGTTGRPQHRLRPSSPLPTPSVHQIWSIDVIPNINY